MLYNNILCAADISQVNKQSNVWNVLYVHVHVLFTMCKKLCSKEFREGFADPKLCTFIWAGN